VNASTYVQNVVIRWMVQGVNAPTPPNPVYLSVHTSDPLQAGTSEVSTSGTGYARTSISATTASAIFGGAHVAGAAPATNGTKQEVSNSAIITLPAPSGTWGTCTYVGLWDAVTGGNFLMSAPMASSIAPLAGNPAPTIAVGAFVIDQQ
jgi:hypothetical protein